MKPNPLSIYLGPVPRYFTLLAAIATATNATAQRRTTEDPGLPPVVLMPPAPVVRTFNLEVATLADMQEALATNALTSVELTTLFLRRIQAYDKASAVAPTQPLNSIGTLNPELLADAAQADRLRKQGAILGPLHGIPFLVKGSIPIADMALTGGKTAWTNFIVPNEAWVVQKLRAGGAVVMGHANMDTWANSATSSTSERWGTVRSSYLAGALPGGSSGGSGVSSGAYLTAFAFGGETGGSIRNPGDRNGCVGFKVSGGSISVNRIIPLVPERDVIGPITRNTLDNAMVRDAVGQLDPNDPWASVLPILTDKRPVPETGFVNAVKTATLAGKKIGIIGTYVGQTHPTPTAPGSTVNTTGVQTPSAVTLPLIARAKADMEALGATVSYVFMPPPVSTTYVRPVGAPVTQLLVTANSNAISAGINRSVIESGVEYPGDTYSQRAVKVLAQASVISQISATVRGLFYTNTDGVYTPGGAILFDSPITAEHYRARGEQKNAFEAWMDAEGLDAVVWPNWVNKTRTGGTIIARDLVNFMHLPAVTVPMGVLQYSTTVSDREPLTLDFSGRLYDDVKVLAIASAYEKGTRYRYSPPLAPPLTGEVFPYTRQSVKTPNRERIPPVLTVSTTAEAVGTAPDRVITFSGNVSDASGIDRLEVNVGGIRLPSTVSGNTWTAVLSNTATSAVFLRDAAALELIVLAVDAAGNATTQQVTATLVAPVVP